MHELVQLAESIQRVKAVRKETPDSEVMTVPYILAEAYDSYVSEEVVTGPYEALYNSLDGKEFLIAFENEINLPDTWIDAPLFVLIN